MNGINGKKPLTGATLIEIGQPEEKPSFLVDFSRSRWKNSTRRLGRIARGKGQFRGWKQGVCQGRPSVSTDSSSIERIDSRCGAVRREKKAEQRELPVAVGRRGATSRRRLPVHQTRRKA
jgi:hypothetical protein